MSRLLDFCSSSLDLFQAFNQAVKASSDHHIFICVFSGCQGLVLFKKLSSSNEKSNARLADVVYAKVIIDMHRQQ